mmetsp:Transcript_49234/g.120033  ORF Transcript_49234/g.120033 Transcript_49234/m.120033 type:complete len:127 (+) Transcript_49234:178-558(+)
MSGAAGVVGVVKGTCDVCGVEGDMKICSRCHSAWYCGAACQKEGWKVHRRMCQGLADKFVAEKTFFGARAGWEGAQQELVALLREGAGGAAAAPGQRRGCCHGRPEGPCRFTSERWCHFEGSGAAR